MINFSEISKRVKERRAMLGISRSELARRARLSVSSIQTIERGTAKRGVTLDTLDRLARGLGTPAHYFIGETCSEDQIQRMCHSIRRDEKLAAELIKMAAMLTSHEVPKPSQRRPKLSRSSVRRAIRATRRRAPHVKRNLKSGQVRQLRL